MVANLRVTTHFIPTQGEGAMKMIHTDDFLALKLREQATFRLDKSMTDEHMIEARRIKCLGAYSLERHRQTSHQQPSLTKRSAISRRR